MIFRNYFFTENGVLPIQGISQQGYDNFVINGEQDSLLGAYHGTESSPMELWSNSLIAGGLYTFEIEVRTIDEPTNIIEDSGVYHADLTLVETLLILKKMLKEMMCNLE